MRKPIALILDYLTVTLLCIVAGIFFFTQYFNSLTLVAGKNIDFSADIIAYGLFETLPLIFLFIAMFVIFYKIRHLSSPVSSLITFSVLMAVTWFCFFPFTLVLKEKVYSMLTPLETLENKNELSGGYFRTIDGKIYYFVTDTKDDIADVFKLFDNGRPNSYADRVKKHNTQYPEIEFIQLPHRNHDRFLIIDDKVYFIGASLKDIGTGLCAVAEMEIAPEIILGLVK